MNVFLLLVTAVGVGALGVFALASRRADPALARAAARVARRWAGAYLAVLLLVSAASRPRVLAPGERQAFCGFYLDCHLGVTVEAVERDSTDDHLRLVVTLHVDSDAQQATLGLTAPTALVVDAGGRRYGRDRHAEEALARTGRPAAALTRAVAAGGGFATTLVFTLPRGVERPRLLVRDGVGLGRFVEAFLVGDDDSLFHARTYHALTPAPHRPLPLHSSRTAS